MRGFRFVFADFGDLWVRHKTQNVTVLSESGSFSQVLYFSCCELSCVLSVRLGPLFNWSNVLRQVCLGNSSDAKAANLFCIFVCDLFIMVRICHAWPICVVSVFRGIRLTA